jgi:hypothetical protein
VPFIQDAQIAAPDANFVILRGALRSLGLFDRRVNMHYARRRQFVPYSGSPERGLNTKS